MKKKKEFIYGEEKKKKTGWHSSKNNEKYIGPAFNSRYRTGIPPGERSNSRGLISKLKNIANMQISRHSENSRDVLTQPKAGCRNK